MLASFIRKQEPIERFFDQDVDFSNPYFEALINPLAGELGVNTQEDVEDFVRDVLPRFKLVSGHY